MESKISNKNTPPKSENLKLKEKSEVQTDITHASQRSYKFQKTSIVKHLNLELFKLNPCNITKNHNHKHCMNYHNVKDRKRYGNFYSNTMCVYVKSDQKCPNGDNCSEAHSRVQELYSYQNYKKHFCSHFPNSVEECPYEDFCSFAHSEEDILSNLIHNYAEDDDFYMFYYKTEFCPFNLTEHDKSKCVYAHNLQDYRRTPQAYSYQPIACFNWKTKDYIYDYNSGCEIGPLCNMCHGWKEQQYHPSFYKTIKCEIENCKKGCCPNYHSLKEKRTVENDIVTKCFRYVPKNRIVEGVFKNNVKKQGYKSKPEYKSKTVINQRKNESAENDFKTRTIIQKKKANKKSSGDEKEVKWISDKEIINSEEESDENNEIVISQLGRLNLDE